MFSLFVDVLSYHTQAKVNQDSCARDKTSHSSQSSWETDRENRKMYLVLWKNSRDTFLHEFYQICVFGFFLERKNNSLMLFLTIDFTFSFCGFVNQIEIFKFQFIEWFLRGGK